MSEQEANTPDVQRLVSELIDGTLSDEDRAALIERMQSDPKVRDTYLELMHIDSLLEWDYLEAGLPAAIAPPGEAGHAPAAPLAPAVHADDSARQVTVLRWSLAASVLLSVTLGGLLVQQLGTSQAVAETTSQSSEGGPVAVITDLRKVVWEDPATAPEPYKSLNPGWLKLREGRVALDLFGGSNVMLEGPAELGVNAADRAFLRSGKLSVLCGRHFQPFHVATAQLVAGGRAAEFAVSVDQAATELHVFSGSVQVEWVSSSLPPLELAAGEAIVVRETDGEVRYETAAADATRFAPVIDPAAATPTGEVFQLDFAQFKPQSYGYQDGQFELPSHHEVLDEGKTLRLWGNAWKMVEVNAKITRDTVIEFEFKSPRQGQIHGLGFDNDDQYKSQDQPIFQVYGYEARQDIGQQFNDYSGGQWRRYRLRVGRYLTGPRKYLYFAADEDVTGECESQFRNVRIYEAAE